MKGNILLDHGEGGTATFQLIKEVFLKHLGEPEVLEDAAILNMKGKIAFTTDSFVVRPLFFPGGDLGKLAVTGTVNDLAVMGAKPLYISAGFILEEGLDISVLDDIVASMAETAHTAGVKVVTGDTKVVRKGDIDLMFVNTSGIGQINHEISLSSKSCKPGDSVLVSGTIGEHGIAVMLEREGFEIQGSFKSDCQTLEKLTDSLLESAPDTRCMRDPTRGGLATTLVEITSASKTGMILYNDRIPIRAPVKAACDLLGLDPLYVPCEGRFVAVVPADETESALKAMKSHKDGQFSVKIGQITNDHKGVNLITEIGGIRPIVALHGVQFPRIC